MTPKHQSFGDSVAEHLAFLIRFVKGTMRGDPNAEDIVQQTALKALTNAGQLRSEVSLKPWLVSIAINEIRQSNRSGWRRRTLRWTRKTPVRLEFGRLKLQMRCTRPMSERACAAGSFAFAAGIWLRRCVVRLQQLPLSDAAKLLGLTFPAAKARRQRARQKLIPLLKKLRS